jgi:hypothetical protein
MQVSDGSHCLHRFAATRPLMRGVRRHDSIVMFVQIIALE